MTIKFEFLSPNLEKKYKSTCLEFNLLRSGDTLVYRQPKTVDSDNYNVFDNCTKKYTKWNLLRVKLRNRGKQKKMWKIDGEIYLIDQGINNK